MTKQIDKIMEQAQVFASAWSLVGGRFDGGNAMDDAEVAKNELHQMVAEALAEQPAQQDNTCSNALREQGKAYPRTCKKCGLGPCVELAQQALDKKAENARELKLDYEPVWGGGPTNKDYEDAMRQRRLHQLTSPPAQRKPLTDEEIDLLINGRGDEDDDDYIEPTGDGFGLTDADLVRLVRRVEAAHGIKEKNT